MKSLMVRFFKAAAAVPTLVFSMDAHAYIDPGTGSLILQGLIAAVAGVAVAAGAYWNRIKMFFRGRKKSAGKTDQEEQDVIKNGHASNSSDHDRH